LIGSQASKRAKKKILILNSDYLRKKNPMMVIATALEVSYIPARCRLFLFKY
jgi:hypothetical protein